MYEANKYYKEIPDQKVIFVEPITNQRVYCYERFIVNAAYRLNKTYIQNGDVSLNYWLALLDLKPIDERHKGWSIKLGCPKWVDVIPSIVSQTKRGVSIFALNYSSLPVEDYDRIA